MREDIKIFKDICVKMYEASNLIEFDKSNNIVYGANYDIVVNKVIGTKYGILVSGGLALEEVGYILSITRERVRQLVNIVVGSENTAKCKLTKIMGARASMNMKEDVLGRTTDIQRKMKKGRF